MAQIWNVTINHTDGSNETLQLSSRQLYARIEKLKKSIDPEKHTEKEPHAIYALTYWDDTAIIYDEPLKCSDNNYYGITSNDNVCECYAVHTIEFEYRFNDSVVLFKEGNVYINGKMTPAVYEWEDDFNKIYAHWFKLAENNDRIKIDATGSSFGSIAVAIVKRLNRK